MTTRSTFGEQPNSVKPSAPRYGFGAASREVSQKVFVSQEHTQLATAGKHSPGPAVYLLPPSVGGKQPDGRRADPPSWGFGTANRFRPMSAPPVPGPGHYPMPPGAAGTQTNSRYSTQPQFGFGTSERKHVKKVFISQQHQKTDMYGLDTPGPAYRVELPSSIGGTQVPLHL